jgi:hypothetical protein
MRTIDLTKEFFECVEQSGRLNPNSTKVEFGSFRAEVSFLPRENAYNIFEKSGDHWLCSFRTNSSEGATRLKTDSIAMGVRLRYEGMPVEVGALFEVEDSDVAAAQRAFSDLSDEDVAYAYATFLERGNGNGGFVALHSRMDALSLYPEIGVIDPQWSRKMDSFTATFDAMLPAEAEKRVSSLHVDEYDKFQKKYGFAAQENAITGHEFLLETYGADLDVVRAAKPKCVWTLVEGESGATYLMAGIHKVNRLNFVISEKPWETGNEQFCYQNDFPEEESLEEGSPATAESTLARLTELVELACGEREVGIDDAHWDELASVAAEARTILNCIQKQQETGEHHGRIHM